VGGAVLGGVEPEGQGWDDFKATAEYAAADEEALRFLRTLWLPEDAAPDVNWYRGQLAMFGMMPRR
jgi:hypothetical protein